MIRVLFPCRDCDENVVETAKDGRFYDHKGIKILLPANFVIPRCMGCNQDWFSEELMKKLDAVLEEEYQKHEGLIQSILELYEHNQK